MYLNLKKYELQEVFSVLTACLSRLSKKSRDAFTMRELDDIDSENKM